MSNLAAAKEEAVSLGNQMGMEAEQMANSMGVSLGAMMVDLIPDRMKLWDALKPKDQASLLRHIKKSF